MNRLTNIAPALALLALIVGAWWLAVLCSGSVIFPTPGQVAAGALELAADGTLWRHIGSSLMRVASGFALAVAVAVPVGLWMGRVDGVYRALNPLVQINCRAGCSSAWRLRARSWSSPRSCTWTSRSRRSTP